MLRIPNPLTLTNMFVVLALPSFKSQILQISNRAIPVLRGVGAADSGIDGRILTRPP